MKLHRKIVSDEPVLEAETDQQQVLVLEPDAAVMSAEDPALRWATGIAMLVLFSFAVFWIWELFFPDNLENGLKAIGSALSSTEFWSAAAVGFLAQAVDGALGMAYGITATTFLLGTGVPPAAASASVHIAEVFTTGFSGIAHVKHGNVNKRLFLSLLIPGILGAVLGAVVVTQLDGAVLKPYISLYLLIMGGYILSKAWRQRRLRTKPPEHVGKLAAFGGFVDAVGGGGWGPVVTSTLVGAGQDPRTTIGSVNFAEFFLTLTAAAAFSMLVETTAWATIAGLVFGGLFAAPLAAVLCKKLQPRTLLILVGTLITGLSLFNLWNALT